MGICSEAYDNPPDVDAFLDRATTKVGEVADDTVEDHMLSDAEQVALGMKLIADACQSKDGITGLKTHFADIDNLTGGLQPSEVFVLAGRPGAGKSALALNIGTNIARDSRHVLLVSLEMTQEEVILRRLSAEAQIRHAKLKHGLLKAEDHDFANIDAANKRINGMCLSVDDGSDLTVTAIKTLVRRAARKRGRPVNLLIVDRIGLIEPSIKDSETRDREVARISWELKKLAKAFKIPVMLLAQLNREVEKRNIHRPKLSDLRESGAIEQNANTIAFLWNSEDAKEPENHDPTVPRRLWIAKQRGGETDEIQLTWRKDFVKFESYSDRVAPPDAAFYSNGNSPAPTGIKRA